VFFFFYLCFKQNPENPTFQFGSPLSGGWGVKKLEAKGKIYKFIKIGTLPD
jgi:hypothetical protein